MIKIYCEGITDQLFIADVVEKFFDIIIDRRRKKNKINKCISENVIEIINISGISSLRTDFVIDSLIDNQKLGGVNIVIFDADWKEIGNGNKGIKNCRQKLDNLKSEKNLDFEYYIWPNNQDDGQLENLLCELIPNSKKPIFNCIETNKNCLNSLNNGSIKKIGLKEVINFYLNTCYQSTDERNYNDKNFWSLDENVSSNFQNFTKFLKSNLRNLAQSN